MIFKRLFSKRPDPSQALYEVIVAAARQPKFYAQWGVSDTVDGRFDMISLHMFLVLDRLKDEGPAVEAFRQQLTDTFFRDMDRSLREMGVGDLTVGKKVRKMAEVFYGRVTAYAKALDENRSTLAEAVKRNIFAGQSDGDPSAMASWVIDSHAILRQQKASDIMTATVKFS